MIDSLTYVPRKGEILSWAAKLDYLKRTPVTEFQPGLNILFGSNGSGKSTLLQLLGNALAATQGGTSVVTQSWMRDVLDFGGSDIKLPCDIVHDGQPIMYFDARAKEGLIGRSFDDDFFSLGIANTMSKGSTGQLGFMRLDRLLQVLVDKHPAKRAAAKGKEGAPAAKRGSRTAKSLERKPAPPLVPQGFPEKIEYRVSRGTVNDSWAQRFDVIDEILRAKRPVGPKTLIFDEPESGFSMAWQAGLWQNVFSKVDPERFQLIIATHSPFALGIPGANYIEMEPGYLAECMLATMSLQERIFPRQKKESADA